MKLRSKRCAGQSKDNLNLNFASPIIAERLSARQLILRRISEIVCMYVCMYVCVCPSRFRNVRATRKHVITPNGRPNLRVLYEWVGSGTETTTAPAAGRLASTIATYSRTIAAISTMITLPDDRRPWHPHQYGFTGINAISAIIGERKRANLIRSTAPNFLFIYGRLHTV